MLNEKLLDVSVNLAMIARDQKVDLSPLSSTLMAALSTSVKNDFYATPTSVEDLKLALANVSSGTMAEVAGNKTYQFSTHDTLMDNYSVDLAQLVSNHVVYARSVVYAQVMEFVERCGETLASIPMKDAADFFSPHYITKHDIFNTHMVSTEVMPMAGLRATEDIFNMRQSFLADRTEYLSLLVTGSEDDDELIKLWYSTVGESTIAGYLTQPAPANILSWFQDARMNYHMANFLFYRALAAQPRSLEGAKIGMTLSQLTHRAVSSRDHHACRLAQEIKNYDLQARTGFVLDPSSETSYSYLNPKGLQIGIYEENFKRACEDGATLDQVFGHIAKNGTAILTIDALKVNGEALTEAWRAQRSMYAMHAHQSKHATVRSTMKSIIRDIMESPTYVEALEPVHAANSTYKDQTLKLCEKYIDTASAEGVSNLRRMGLELIGKIAHRHSAAYFLISTMVDLMDTDPALEPADAILPAVTLYVTDFLMSQLTMTKR